MFEKILPNTDNFFKYLLTIGIILIFFAILYPLQKQQEVDLLINEYAKNLSVYNYKLDLLEQETANLEAFVVQAQEKINHLDSLKSTLQFDADSLQEKMVELKSAFESQKEILLEKGDELKMTQISQKYEGEKIAKMETYLSSYWIFKFLFILIGVLLTLFGIRFWAASTYLEEQLKAKDYDPTYKHSYVRCLDWIKKYVPWF